jgi:hypothetical protein
MLSLTIIHKFILNTAELHIEIYPTPNLQNLKNLVLIHFPLQRKCRQQKMDVFLWQPSNEENTSKREYEPKSREQRPMLVLCYILL